MLEMIVLWERMSHFRVEVSPLIFTLLEEKLTTVAVLFLRFDKETSGVWD